MEANGFDDPYGIPALIREGRNIFLKHSGIAVICVAVVCFATYLCV
jgi:hypothetical protein